MSERGAPLICGDGLVFCSDLKTVAFFVEVCLLIAIAWIGGYMIERWWADG